MKTSTSILFALVIMTTLCTSATNLNKTENRSVTSQQVANFLSTGSHHHTVFSVNVGNGVATAEIEGCRRATVYLYGGTIIGHIDSQVACY